MPASTSAARRSALCGAFLGALLVGSAAAQQEGGGPTSLAPPGITATPAATQSADPVDAQPRKSGIEIDQLGVIDAGTHGTLGVDQGGFGPGLWDGTNRATVERLARLYPPQSYSPTLNDLGRRLLLSRARAPVSVAAGGAADTGGRRLIALRLSLLFDHGQWAEVGELARAVPDANDDSSAKAEADAALAANDLPRACTLAATWAPQAVDLYWQSTLAYCEFLADQPDKAMFSAGLLRERGGVTPIYFTLMDALLGGAATAVEDLSPLPPLPMAMLRTAQAAVPETTALGSDPWRYRAVAETPHFPDALRAEAAELAVLTGALGPEDLARLYQTLTFDDAQLDDALYQSDSLPASLGRALLYRAMDRQGGFAQAEALAGAYLDSARLHDRSLMAMRVVAPTLRHLRPDQVNAAFAPHAARALMISGDTLLTRQWVRALTHRGDRSVHGHMVPLIRLAGVGEEQWDPAVLDRWMGQITNGGVPEPRRKALLALNLLEGMGETLPDYLWQNLRQDDAEFAGASAVYALEEAATAGRVGETVLRAIAAMGDKNLRFVDPRTVGAAVAGLRRVGLTREARALAVEAAIAGGL